jgi:hypothetical protein
VIALFTFLPSFCPNCGRRGRITGLVHADFDAFASFSCVDCGLDYQRVDEEHALDAAEAAGGDLKRMREMAS